MRFLYKNLALHPSPALRAVNKKCEPRSNVQPGSSNECAGPLKNNRSYKSCKTYRTYYCFLFFSLSPKRREGVGQSSIFSCARQKLPGFLCLVPVDPVYDAHVEIRLFLEHCLFFLV